MIANIISRYALTLADTIKVSQYDLDTNSEYDGKSQIILHRQPKASEEDFILLYDNGLIFQGIIDSIENEKGQNHYTVTAVELPKLFDQKVVLSNESLLSTGIEDFIADQITSNFISSNDSLLNISYLTVTAKTHTPVLAKVDATDGIYNLCTYMGNALTSYGIFIDFEFTKDALNITIENRQQADLNVDTGLANVLNLVEVYETKALAKLTVLWTKEGNSTVTKQFFLKTDRSITNDINDADRAKGSVDVITSTAETEAEMQQEAIDKFKANSYQHKITFDVIPSKLIPVSELYVGHQLQVKTASGIKDSIITGIGQSNNKTTISVTLGQMKVTLIEKLKGVEAKA